MPTEIVYKFTGRIWVTDIQITDLRLGLKYWAFEYQTHSNTKRVWYSSPQGIQKRTLCDTKMSVGQVNPQISFLD